MSESDKKRLTIEEKSEAQKEIITNAQEKLYHDELMKQYFENRGSKYKPMNIAPFRYDRERLSGVYTDEDRKLRKQYLEDQVLSAREPVNIPEVMPQNIFLRTFKYPFNSLASGLEKFGGKFVGDSARFVLPKLAFMYLAAAFIYYKAREDNSNWESAFSGWHSNPMAFKPVVFPGDIEKKYVNLRGNDFDDRGFKSRTSHLGSKLRSSTEISWRD